MLIKTISLIRKKSRMRSSISSNKTPMSWSTSPRTCSDTTVTTTEKSPSTSWPTSAPNTTSEKWRFSASTERSFTPKAANAEWTAASSAPPSTTSSDTSVWRHLLSSSTNGFQWSTWPRRVGSVTKCISCSSATTSAALQSQRRFKCLHPSLLSMKIKLSCNH